jgi:hypothetical protein
MNNNTQTIWLTLKSDVPNNLPQTFTLADGGKLVYYPDGNINNSKGVKKMNSNSYKVQSCYGEVVEVTNLSSFCKTLFGTTENTNKPKYISSFSDMFNGIRKENNVMGWTKFQEPDVTEPQQQEPDNPNSEENEDTEAVELLFAA